MIKHILTKECNRKCTYCITKNVKAEQCMDCKKYEYVYEHLSKTNDSIMLTGGEPTMARGFDIIRDLAVRYFKEVYITSQNERVLIDKELTKGIKAISFSIHDEDSLFGSPVRIDTPIYACILACDYSFSKLSVIRMRGFNGLTLNEEQRAGKRFRQSLPESEGFSIRVNRKGKCLKDTILLPDLQIISGFAQYL